MAKHRVTLPSFLQALILVAALPSAAPWASGNPARGGVRAQEAPPPSLAAAQQAVVGKLLERLDTEDESQFWVSVQRLKQLGSDGVPLLAERLDQGSERQRLACATAVVAMGDESVRERAIDVVAELAERGRDRGVRAASIELLGREGDPEEAFGLLEKILERTIDPQVAIPAARALWDLDRLAAARDRLIELLGSNDLEVRRLAAVTLAEIGYFEGDVRTVLRELKDEPSALGRRAEGLYTVIRLSRQLDAGAAPERSLPSGVDPEKLLRIKEERIRSLEDELEKERRDRAASPPRPGSGSPLLRVIEEVMLQIDAAYVDPAKTESRELVIDALKGMVGGLDEFSSFMDPRETETFQQSIAGEYFGIGAQVQMAPDGPLEILKPIYGGPAYQAGLLSGDRILEVDGVPTDGRPIQEIIDRLKGPEKTTVRLMVIRRGWAEPKEIQVERRMVEVPSVYSQLLPGGIGYVLLLQFGERSADEFVAALDDLEAQGMEGLVFDLRNDPGGRLDIAVRIADQFVAGDLPIVTQKGRGDRGRADEVSTYPNDFKRKGYPIVVLINERSASASEIVAGALQDFGRATLVGKRTFGKGSVQRLLPLSTEASKALGGPAQLRLTVQYYFLPLGRCIHTVRDETGVVTQQGGVQPDIEVDAEEIPAWRYEERERLRTDERVLAYSDRHAGRIQELFVQGDGRDPSRYPDFDELYDALDTQAPKEDLRVVLRYHARRGLEDAAGKEFACDFQEDVQLQAAIREVLKKAGKRPEDIPRYAGLGLASPEGS